MADIKPKIYNNPALGQKQVSANTPYGKPADKEGEEGKTLSDVRDKFAPKADIPTSASAKPGELDLPSILKKVDPKNLSSILPSMFEQLAKVNSVLNASAPSSRKVVIQDSLTGALQRLSNKYGFTKVIKALDKALDNYGILQIEPAFLSVVENAIANLIQAVMQYGNYIPISELPVIIYGTSTPAPLVTIIPDLCTKQYYTPETDPYPGYIHWIAVELNSYYVRRGPTDYPFSTMEEETKVMGEVDLANKLAPYIYDNTLTAALINQFLGEQDSYIESTNMENNVGKNSSTNLAGLATSILGDVGKAVGVTSQSLANSVLSSTGINKALDEFTKNLSVLQKMKTDAEGIIKIASSLTTLPNVSNIVSSLNIPTEASTAVKGVLSKLGIS